MACVLILSICVGACASSPQTGLLLDNPPDVPPLVELTEVPFFPQQEYQSITAARPRSPASSIIAVQPYNPMTSRDSSTFPN
jgi:hypothetical protein